MRGLGPRVVLYLLPCVLPAQETRRSQHGSVTQRVATTEIAISYNRPVARGRDIFGGIIPWGRIWHPGADSATTISFSTGVTLDGHPIAAGRYTLWTIPEEAPKPWTMIVSRAVNIWHTPYPGEPLDLVRFRVTPETGSHMETLAYYFPMVDADSAVLRLHWGTMVVPMRIRTRE